MKKILVATILGLAATASVLAQGRIQLESYVTATVPYPVITYGSGSGGTVGDGITAPFTIGLYYTLAASTPFVDPTGVAIPGGFTLGTGPGSTAQLQPSYPGLYISGGDFVVPSWVSGAISAVVVAYNGADYASSTVRGHSIAFNINPATGTDAATATGPLMGGGFQVFSVAVIPEPSTFALAGLGLASLVIFRRRK